MSLSSGDRALPNVDIRSDWNAVSIKLVGQLCFYDTLFFSIQICVRDIGQLKYLASVLLARNN